ncbi:MAG: 3-hydroxyacyl-ACP dehydratase FabZ [Clostridium sp.]|jgi:3-hydroxyacyl-[acyl-carrier-protein] dehydratase|uniref:3-hydroxyacyl-ACP dehydratase FabZ n=1 Tax=Clostridium sp. TaxID=1506 RepID=UPI0025C0C486|nr:3-hydroxyacyl-ACP dehydratase FabZ [Clostridium sp.]MCH3965571.1 3-hydroxyacyl-ACP dehydratase FabZ [Clostridium sp.]MCI1716899.1 3-hydroxyacyl-ACP dehydratase FabZ [Clostridium sp.]MCI1801171.1 3-hydroxyacyl-ACP dehydratase FabZ [Clostridium sp.]MCI1815085.1 3-hydroxyacyl-ACP dehydratase FabZ [Clostridium sp.]MCI1871988.1 3-hydroxyacyl-ACP dehydratase FabZ [Clostridium sp.]
MENTDFNVKLGMEEIKKIIPHRYPFLLIDRVTYMEPGKKVIAYKNVTANEYFFQGHFPEMPVMPGVLIIEALAQAGAVAILSKDEFKNKIAFFGGINKAKFRHMVVPGDTLTLTVEILKIKGPAGIGKATAYVEEKKAAEAELMFMIGDKN